MAKLKLQQKHVLRIKRVRLTSLALIFCMTMKHSSSRSTVKPFCVICLNIFAFSQMEQMLVNFRNAIFNPSERGYAKGRYFALAPTWGQKN